SVVVVLPASMWAMIPMLRVRSSDVLFLVAVVMASFPSSCRAWLTARVLTPFRRGVVRSLPRLPAVVREGLVGLGHPVEVVLPVEGASLRAQRVPQLLREPLAHLL